MKAVVLMRCVIAMSALLTYPVTALALPKCQGKDEPYSFRSNCYGSHTFLNGDRYTGDYDQYNRMVTGTYAFISGKTFKGRFDFNGLPTHGTVTWENGDWYYGGVSAMTDRERDPDYYWANQIPDHVNGGVHIWPSGLGVFISKTGLAKVGYFRNENHYEGGRPRLEKIVATGVLDSSQVFMIPPEDTPSYDSQFPVCFSAQYSANMDQGRCYALEFIPDVGKYFGEFSQASNSYEDSLVPSGKGTLDFFDGSTYVGGFRDGLRHGNGTLIFNNGDKYIGDWVDDLPNGSGIFTWPEGEYQGDFKDNRFTGVGSLKLSDGTIYVGDWQGNKRHGIGVQSSAQGELQAGIFEQDVLVRSGGNWPRCISRDVWDSCIGLRAYDNGDAYSGYWKNDKRHGLGIYTWHNGMTYVGDWQAGIRYGTGIETFANGDVYQGDYQAGKQDGKGTLTFSTGAKYIGDFAAGKRSGQGTLIFGPGDVAGDIYEGEFLDGIRTGQGTYIFASGDVYQGDWLKGKKHGLGSLTYANGEQIIGRFENDEYIDPKQRAASLKRAAEQIAKQVSQLRDLELGKGFVRLDGTYVTILNPSEYNSTQPRSWAEAHPAIKFIATEPGIQRGGSAGMFLSIGWFESSENNSKNSEIKAEEISKCAYKSSQELPLPLHDLLGKVEKIKINFNKINWQTKEFSMDSSSGSSTYSFDCSGTCLSVFGLNPRGNVIDWSDQDTIRFTFENKLNLFSRGKKALKDIEGMCNASSSEY